MQQLRDLLVKQQQQIEALRQALAAQQKALEAIEFVGLDFLALDEDFSETHVGRGKRTGDKIAGATRKLGAYGRVRGHYSITVLMSPIWADFLSALITICAGRPVVSSSGR